MTYRGRVKNGVIVLDDPIHLEEGTVVRVEIPSQTVVTAGGHAAPLSERLAAVIGKAEALPANVSEDHDLYLRGTRPR